MQFFEKLPPNRFVRATRIDWEKAKAELIANEGQWGLVAENVSNSTPYQLRMGRNRHFRGDDLKNFEFSTRRPEFDPDSDEEPYGPRRTDLYGRYTSKTDADA